MDEEPVWRRRESEWITSAKRIRELSEKEAVGIEADEYWERREQLPQQIVTSYQFGMKHQPTLSLYCIAYTHLGHRHNMQGFDVPDDLEDLLLLNAYEEARQYEHEG